MKRIGCKTSRLLLVSRLYEGYRAALLYLALLIFVGGCEMYRTVEVQTRRVEVESSSPVGLTPTLAADLFHDVAKTLGYAVQGPSSVLPPRYEFTADSPGLPRASQPQLVLWVDDKRIRFESQIYGTSKEFTNALAAAALFKQALDKRGITYETRIWKDLGILGP